jgi:hypothetical protein
MVPVAALAPSPLGGAGPTAMSAPLTKEVEVNGVRLPYVEEGSESRSSSSMGRFLTFGSGSRSERRSQSDIGSSPIPRDIMGSGHGRMAEKNTVSRPMWTISPSSSRHSMQDLCILSAGPAAAGGP